MHDRCEDVCFRRIGNQLFCVEYAEVTIRLGLMLPWWQDAGDFSVRGQLGHWGDSFLRVVRIEIPGISKIPGMLHRADFHGF